MASANIAGPSVAVPTITLHSATWGFKPAETSDTQAAARAFDMVGLDVGERPGSLKTGNGWNCRMRSDAEENPIAGQHARPAVIETHLQRFRRHEAPAPHDQFGPGHLVVLQMQVDLAVDHLALALA